MSCALTYEYVYIYICIQHVYNMYVLYICAGLGFFVLLTAQLVETQDLLHLEYALGGDS